MAERVECKREDGVFVRLDQRCDGFRRLGVRKGIVVDGAGRVSGHEQGVMYGMPFDACRSAKDLRVFCGHYAAHS